MNRRITDLIHKTLTAAFVLIAALGVVFGAKAAFGKTAIFKKAHTVNIKGQIRDNINYWREDVTKIAKTSTRVNLVISSPGGSVYTGIMFVENMKRLQSRGKKFYCVVDRLAMSMAFVILSVCDYRYILNSSLLLFHPSRMGMDGYVTAKSSKLTAKQLEMFDTYLDTLQRPVLKLSDKIYEMYGDNDMIITGYHMSKISPTFGVVIDDFKVLEGKK